MPDTTMSDEYVILLADQTMDPVQDRRLADLQAKRKSFDLTPYECHEFLTLMQIYQLGLFRKSQGLAEVARRGLREPLPS